MGRTAVGMMCLLSLSCGSTPYEPPPAGTGGGGAASTPPATGALVCTKTGATCSCSWSAAAAASSTQTPCFSNRAATPPSPNICCNNSKNIGAGYSCTCAPAVASGWRCYSFSTGCQCGPPSLQPSAGWTSIAASACVGSNGGVCGYDPGSDDCTCFNTTAWSLGPAYNYVDHCKVRPAQYPVLMCPAGQVEAPAATPWACDGDCHPESCFGQAPDDCSYGSCSKRAYVCSQNQCITIPVY